MEAAKQKHGNSQRKFSCAEGSRMVLTAPCTHRNSQSVWRSRSALTVASKRPGSKYHIISSWGRICYFSFSL